MEPAFLAKTLVKNLSVTTFEAEPSSKMHNKKESMHRRLSIQLSVEELLKNIKCEELDQKNFTDNTSAATTLRKTLGLQSLANMPERKLKEKYISNPFFQAHVKHLTRQGTEIKTLNKMSRKKSIQNKQRNKMMNYLQHAQILEAKRSQIIDKLKQTISQDERHA